MRDKNSRPRETRTADRIRQEQQARRDMNSRPPETKTAGNERQEQQENSVKDKAAGRDKQKQSTVRATVQ